MARDAARSERHDRSKGTTMSARTNPWRLEPAERALRVEAGQVVCPRRGVVDIEACWTCPEYRGLTDGRSEHVVCGLSEESLASAVWALDHDGLAEGDPLR
jgi:hypothetical protein